MIKNELGKRVKKTLGKEERLCSKKIIESIFNRQNTTNNGFLVYPIRVVFQQSLAHDTSHIINHTPQVLFSVSKRNFKKAVDRNLIRRRMREAYRLNKTPSLNENPEFYIAFVYIAKEICDFGVIEKSIKKILGKMLNFEKK